VIEVPSVSQIMTRPVVTINALRTVQEAAQLMKEKQIESLVVCWQGRAVGIITEKDFVHRMVAPGKPHDTPIREVMSRPVIMVDHRKSIRDAARLMVEHDVRRLPVKDGLKVVGMVVASDFIRYESKQSTTEKIIKALTRTTETAVTA